MTPGEKEARRRFEIIDAVLEEVENDTTREIKHLSRIIEGKANCIEYYEDSIMDNRKRIYELNYLVEHLESLIVLDYDTGEFGELV